jgi:Response regulators consisting of a CheY-like receiver domain and a winged-helix DNA-binding domain
MASGRRFLLFSENSLFAEALKEQIAALPETKGLEVTSSFKEAVDLAKKDFFDAAIVNDSIELCEGLRKTGFDRTIILIAPASKEPEDDTSVSDFIETPLRFTAFASRLYHSIISHENQDKKGFVVGYFTFNPKTRTAKSNLDSREYPLTEKEADILTYLYRAEGKTVDKDTLLREVWGYNAEVATHTLETHIYRLRQKIDLDPSHPLIICDEGGYRLVNEQKQ